MHGEFHENKISPILMKFDFKVLQEYLRISAIVNNGPLQK